MKKLLLIIPFLFLYINYNYEIKPVNSYLEKDTLNIDEYQMFELLLNDVKINTNNFNTYFEDYKIISITPYLNPIYKSKLKTDLTYHFKSIKIKNNINGFIQFYEKELRKSGYIQNLELIYYNGIKIDKVILYSKLENINQLIKKYPKIKYNVL